MLPTSLGAATAAVTAAPKPPPSRCAQPGHRKSQRAAQERELGVRRAGAPAAAAASHASAFTLLAQSGLADEFLEVDPDMEARVLERWALHNKEMKRAHKQQQRHG